MLAVPYMPGNFRLDQKPDKIHILVKSLLAELDVMFLDQSPEFLKHGFADLNVVFETLEIIGQIFVGTGVPGAVFKKQSLRAQSVGESRDESGLERRVRRYAAS